MVGPGRSIRVYVDTSVIGGCLDDEFRAHHFGCLIAAALEMRS